MESPSRLDTSASAASASSPSVTEKCRSRTGLDFFRDGLRVSSPGGMVTAFEVKRRASELRPGPNGRPQKMRWQPLGSPVSSASRRSAGTLFTRPSPSWKTTVRTASTRTVPSYSALRRSAGTKRMSASSGWFQCGARAPARKPAESHSVASERASSVACRWPVQRTRQAGEPVPPSMRSMSGAPYATSVPLPGPARPMRSLPRAITGIAADWKGVGTSIPSAARAATVSGSSGRCSKVVIGGVLR